VGEPDGRVRELVDRLRLMPHPEGGYYRQVYRSCRLVHPLDDRAPRASLTTIYYLLAAGQHSRWHRVRSDEAWHFYEGDPLALMLLDPELQEMSMVTLGPVGCGSPVHVVPAGWWQAARPTGLFSLVGCTVAPGFEFDDFSLLRDDEACVDVLRVLSPAMAALI
jgi:hypothetical protein